MKKLSILLIVIAMALLSACGSGPNGGDKDTILLLKVDYLTHSFEGATEIQLSQPAAKQDSLPIEVHYLPPGDFGNISLHYTPTDDSLFDGSVIWMGCGHIKYPNQLTPASQFTTSNTPAPLPVNADFQQLFGNQNHPMDSIWYAVDQLDIVKEYAENDKKVGYFLYTPSVGVGNPADWDYILFMSK